MAPLKKGDSLPDGIVFEWTPITNKDPTLAGTSQDYNASRKWSNKKVVPFSVLGAFIPSCQANHLTPFIQNLDKLKEKGVDIVAVSGYNDSWVMSAWGKVNRIYSEEILFLSDTKRFFSKTYCWDAGMGNHNGRWAMVIDNGKVTYAENESDPTKVSVSEAEAVLKAL